MAAPVGNRFWELRSKHGRDKIFTTPQAMWEAACEYFEWCQDNPLISVEFYGKDAIECNVPKMRPFTMEGLCHYLDVNTMYFRDFEQGLAGKDGEIEKDYSRIVSRIRETIDRQQFEGASAGFLNANIIARKLGLSDKKEMAAVVTTDSKTIEDIANKINAL